MNGRGIAYENGKFWVLSGKEAYFVMEDGMTDAQSESVYELTEHGLSAATARCDYLADGEKAAELVEFAKQLNYYMTEADPWQLQESRENIERVIVKKLVDGIADMAVFSPESATKPSSIEMKKLYVDALVFFAERGFITNGRAND